MTGHTEATSTSASASASASASEQERLARVALNVVTEPADPRVARLVADLGAVELYERLAEDVDLAGVRSEMAERLATVDPAHLLERADALGIRCVVPGDAEWPTEVAELDAVDPLNGLAGAPIALWVRGPAPLSALLTRSVAVVGSRSATTYGTSVAGDIAAHLADNRVTVVSGAAFGIDQAAHRGALGTPGATVAVLACGVDRAYPTAHQALLDYIGRTGAIVSELPPGCSPTRVRFLSRNRLIAALTSGTVVVEAAVRSGALNTANWAGRLNRLLMGVPGPVTSAPSEGVHELVRSGAASLVTRGEHVLELVSPTGVGYVEPRRAPVTARDRLDRTQTRVLEAVPVAQPAPPVSIARTAGLAFTTVLDTLRGLEQGGWVTAVGDAWRRSTRPPV